MSMKHNKKDKIKVSFLGTSSEDVTESIYLVTVGKTNILMDCGLYQNNNMIKDYHINHRKIKGLKPKQIDFVLVSHSNIDHIGKIPLLYKDGCSAPIYCVKGNAVLMKSLWKDSIKIMESDADKLFNKYGMKATPLYSNEDIDVALSKIIEVDYHSPIVLTDEVEVEFYGAGHIIASSQIYLTIKQKDRTVKRIGYTGDIGSPILRKNYVVPFEELPYCDVLIGESTYCGNKRNHTIKDIQKDTDKIKHIIRTNLKDNNGKVLLPVFSLDRLQNILTFLYTTFVEDEIFDYKVVVDTPLGIKLSHLFEEAVYNNDDLWDKVMNWNNIIWSYDYSDSLYYQKTKEPMIILASSGMMVNGRSVAWSKILLPSYRNHIVFCGYAGENTLAYQIKNKPMFNKLNIDGVNIVNNAQVSVLNSFSSHACYKELLEYYSKSKYKKVYLVHSTLSDRIEFAQTLQEEIYKRNNTNRVFVPNSSTVIRI